MNMFKRWYDADSVVSRAINELEKSSEEIQVRCADYIIENNLQNTLKKAFSQNDVML